MDNDELKALLETLRMYGVKSFKNQKVDIEIDLNAPMYEYAPEEDESSEFEISMHEMEIVGPN